MVRESLHSVRYRYKRSNSTEIRCQLIRTVFRHFSRVSRSKPEGRHTSLTNFSAEWQAFFARCIQTGLLTYLHGRCGLRRRRSWNIADSRNTPLSGRRPIIIHPGHHTVVSCRLLLGMLRPMSCTPKHARPCQSAIRTFPPDVSPRTPSPGNHYLNA